MQTFINLFSLNGLMPHGFCLAWSPLLLWLTVISDLLITLSYYSIPATILYFLYKRKESRHNWIGVLFAFFILACGTTHLFSAITIWIPLYWAEGFLKAFTALISVITASSMLWFVPHVLSLPTKSQLEIETLQRKNAEKKLLVSNNRFNIIASRIPGMIYQFYLDSEGKATFPFVSEGIYELCGIRPEEVREDASPFFAIIHPEDFDGIFASIQIAVKNLAPWSYDFRIKHNDGTERWLAGHSLPEQDVSGLWYWYGYMSDITLQKQLAEKLRISENMKRGILQSSLDAIFTIDNNDIITNYNPSTLSTFGYTHQEIQGKKWIDLFIPERFRDNYQLIPSKYIENYKNLELNKRFELIGYRKNEEFAIEISITPISIVGLNFFSVLIRNISERKKAEALLLKGQQAAEHANTVKSQFLAMMSHEIRTPLNAILGMQELLTHTRLDNTQTEYLQTAALAGNNLLALINDILDLTKVEAGKLDLEEIPLNVIELTQLCVQLVSVMAQAKGLKLITVIDPELTPWISGDPLRFRQVLLNLLSNAIKFTEQGSVTVTLSSYVSTDRACVLLVEVIDTGIGIPENLQAGLFEVFVQVDPSDTRKYGGSGLGLAISKRLVTLWGGQIGIDSTPYVGSRFWFTVGTLAEAPKQPVIPTIKQDDSHRKYNCIARVLLVEDSLINQAVLAAMLRNGGHQVDLADCGAKGIEAASEKVYDIILMDVSMPDMSGMEATAIIRQLGGAATSVPIIAITAHALAGYEAMCLAAGMNGYATKPISQKDLLALVETWSTNKDSQTTAVISPLLENSPALPFDEQEINLDKAILDELTATLGKAQVKELLQIYLTELNSRCETIKQAIISQDLSVLSREGHTIKSSSATFGANSLQALGKELEACGYNDDLATALLVAEKLLLCAEATMKAMRLSYKLAVRFH